MLQDRLQDNTHDCGCHKEISPKASKALRLEYTSTSEDKKILIQEYKTKLAQIYTSLGTLEAPKTEDNQLYDAFWNFQESIYEAQRHLQLASYYITCALTA